MIRAALIALAALLAELPTPAAAQQVWDCVTQPCAFVTDPLARGGTPAERCRLYVNSVMMSEAPVALTSFGRADPYCLLVLQFPPGTFLLWATTVAHDGAESSPSNVLNATMLAGALPPPDAPRGFRRIW